MDPFKIDTVRRYSRPGRLLEIGPAWGTFAYQAKQAGYRVDAIEMDARCCEFLNGTVGIRAVCTADPPQAIAALGPHEVVAAWHAIEHLADPWALLEAAAKNLAPGGILVLASPNPEAWQFGVMGTEWPHVDAPRHLYLIPAQTLTNFVAPLGLECITMSTSDSDAKSWNRFGWQRLLMNRVRGKWPTRIAFVLGYAISTLLMPLETRAGRGSAYTLVFRKTGTGK